MKSGMTSTRHLLLIALVALVGVAATTCRKATETTPPPDTGGKTAFNPLDPLAGAPKPWEAFLHWADEQLTITPDPVALPQDPTIPESGVGLVRLDERLASANVQCDWQPTDRDGAALLSLGPFRSDRPTPRWLVERPKDPHAGLLMTAQGFSVPSKDVGRITIDIKVPWGQHVDLIWSSAGKIRLPLPSHDRLWTLSVTTDGLADWQGPLPQLAIRTDGVGTGVVEIGSIRLFGRENAFPKPVGMGRVNLDREIRTALYAHTPATIRFDHVAIPPNGKLQTGLGLIVGTQAVSPSSVRFTVRVEYAGKTTDLLSEVWGRPDHWRDVSVSLAAFGGKTVSITLEAKASNGDVALWGNPIIYEPAKKPPIVIVYLIDTLAAQHIGLYGYTRDTMPRLAGLSRKGVWFANAFANSPKTVNSIPDIFFSMPTERHGVIHASFRAPDELVSLAEVFRAAGYATASFCTNVNAGPRQNVDQGFDHFFDHIAYWWTAHADRTVPIAQVMNWIDGHGDRPMMLYIHTAEPHGPYTPPQGFAGKFDTGYHGPINGGYDKKHHGFHTARTPEEIAYVVSLYDEECAYADHRLHTFLEAVRSAGLYERMSLVVTADHGEEFLEHGAWTHGENLHNEAQRVPLLFVGPKVTARGEVDAPVQLHDIMPTMLDQFGLPQPYALNGDSLTPFLQDARGERSSADEFTSRRRNSLAQRTLFASNHAYISAHVIEAAVIERGRWKLLYRFAREPMPTTQRPVRFELYDLERDHNERHDVIAEHQPLARKLIGKLIAYRRTQPPYEAGIDTEQLELDPDQLRELQSLGYIGQFENDDTK